MNNDYTQQKIFDRILQSIETIAEISAKVGIIEKVCNRLDTIVNIGNGSLPLVIRVVKLEKDNEDYKRSIDNLEKSSKEAYSEDIKGKWNFRTALISSLPNLVSGLIGGGIVGAMLKLFGH